MNVKWLVCFSTALFFLFESTSMFMLNTINIDVTNYFHLSVSQLTTLTSSYFYGTILFIFPAGYILDRFSNKKIICFAMLISIIGVLGFGLSKNFYEAVFFRFINGISGGSFSFLGAEKIIAMWFEEDEIPLATGIVLTFSLSGGVIAQYPTAYLTSIYGWRISVLIFSLIGVFILAIMYFFIVENKKFIGKKIFSNGLVYSLKKAVFTAKNLYASLFACFLNASIVLLGGVWGTKYFIEKYQISEKLASYGPSLLFFGLILGFTFVGKLVSKYINTQIMMSTFSLLVFFLSVFLLYFSHNLFADYLMFFILGVISSIQMLGYTIIINLNPKILCASALSLASFIIMGSNIVFQKISSFILVVVSNSNLTTVNPLAIALIIIPITALLGFLISIFVSFNKNNSLTEPYATEGEK